MQKIEVITASLLHRSVTLIVQQVVENGERVTFNYTKLGKDYFSPLENGVLAVSILKKTVRRLHLYYRKWSEDQS